MKKAALLVGSIIGTGFVVAYQAAATTKTTTNNAGEKGLFGRLCGQRNGAAVAVRFRATNKNGLGVWPTIDTFLILLLQQFRAVRRRHHHCFATNILFHGSDGRFPVWPQ
jgi:hypothetical protein